MNLNKEHWQILAAEVARETEPKRLAALLDALIQALDQRRKALRQAGPGGAAEPGAADD
jgi:hypothetical protein